MPTPAERVAASADLRAALAAARAWGAPPSVFLGRELTTRYEYDPGTGRMSASTPEAAWTQDDRDLAVALLDWEADLCAGCHTPLAETTAAENEENYRVEVGARCHKCTALAQMEKTVQDKAHPSAILLRATLKTREQEHDHSVPAG